MAFKNRIRLPFFLSKPQFPTERSVFPKANGTIKVLSVVVRNTMQGETDYLPEHWHRKLVIALSHDDVTIEGDRYIGGVVLDGDYQIDWLEFMDYPVAKSAFQIQVTPFSATNSNCMSCSQISQLSLVDDTYPVTLGDGEPGGFNVYDNDSICCYPAVGEVVYTNDQFISTANLSPDGSFSFTAQNPVPSQNNVKIATYRVTCEDGSYDEADVYASFDGSGGPVCCQPDAVSIDEGVTTISFEAGCDPDNGFVWDIRAAGYPGVPLVSGTVPGNERTVTIPELITANPGDYIFTIYSDCGGSQSETTIFNFNVPTGIGECYGFDANYSALSGPSFATFSYMNCAGSIVNQVVGRFSVVRVCAAVNTGTTTPIFWASDQPFSSLTPMAPCGTIEPIEGNYDVSTTELEVCSAPVGIIAYTSEPFGPGVAMWTDPGLTTRVTGYSFIHDAFGVIYNLHPGTGIVGLPTGNSC